MNVGRQHRGPRRWCINDCTSSSAIEAICKGRHHEACYLCRSYFVSFVATFRQSFMLGISLSRQWNHPTLVLRSFVTKNRGPPPHIKKERTRVKLTQGEWTLDCFVTVKMSRMHYRNENCLINFLYYPFP